MAVHYVPGPGTAYQLGSNRLMSAQHTVQSVIVQVFPKRTSNQGKQETLSKGHGTDIGLEQRESSTGRDDRHEHLRRTSTEH